MNFETVRFCNEAIAADFEAHDGIHLETAKKKPRQTSVTIDGDLA